MTGGAAARQRARAERWPRSYLRRQGHATRAQRRALREHWPRLGLELDMRTRTRLDLDACFGRRAPRTLEIGFGMGDALLAAAAAHPERDFLGAEVHRPGLGAALIGISERELSNLRLVRGDAIVLLRDFLGAGALDRIVILFPDPWPRETDRHRRLVRPQVVALLQSVLAAEGRVSLATDVADYAEQMRQAFGGWQPTAVPERATTLYEVRARERGETIHELCYTRATS